MSESNSEKPISLKIMKQAFSVLDKKLSAPLILIMGGGGAMISAHDYPLATTDVDNKLNFLNQRKFQKHKLLWIFLTIF
jgi:hypothetical protein